MVLTVNKSITIILTLFLCGLDSFCQISIVQEGLYHNFSKLPGMDSFQVNRLWFKDSSIIYELKVNIEAGENDSVIYIGYDAFRYRYFDLKTATYYEYDTFTDTASIRCKYLWEEGFVAGFFSYKNKLASTGFIMAGDTILAGESLKRIKYVDRKPEYNYLAETIYYFACHGEHSDLWGLNPSFKFVLPNCFLRQRDVVSYDSTRVMKGIDRFLLQRASLTAEEEKIFAAWKTNAQNNNVPLSTVAEMLKIPISPIKFRNNPKYPMYN